MRTYVFGYGSLVHLGSLSKGLQRTATTADLRPATLRDHRRIWGASELVHCIERPGITCARFLDLEPAPGGEVNGALIAVTPAELDSLLVREKAYALHDVSSCVDGLAPDERAVTFASVTGRSFAGTVVLAEYVRLVLDAFEALAPGERERFLQLTAPVDLELVSGLYRFVDPEQNARTSRADEVIPAKAATQ
jgi:hypothetical protein